jgi:hypothetical protein
MSKPIWIDLTATDGNAVVINAAHIVGLSYGPRRGADGQVVHDQVIVNLVAPVAPYGAAVHVSESVDDVRAAVKAAG